MNGFQFEHSMLNTTTPPNGPSADNRIAGIPVTPTNSTEVSAAAKNHQESMLNKLTKTQQIDVLKFAQSHQIRPEDPTWILVEMLGHVRFTTDTLPARIEAAGNNAVEAINQQRLVEQKAFSVNAMREMDSMLSTISSRFAKEAKKITDEQMHRRLIINSLMTISWVTLLITGSVLIGYFFAQGHVYWGVRSDAPLINRLSVLLNLPAGYIIFPWLIAAIIMIGRYYWIDRKNDGWR